MSSEELSELQGSLDNLKSEVEKGRKHLGLKDDDPLP